MHFYDVFRALGYVVGFSGSPLNAGAGSQVPLQDSSSKNLVAQRLDGPHFYPPSGSFDSDLECKYPSMKDWRHAAESTNRQSWLWNTVNGDTFDIHTNYDKKWPIGITRNYTLNVTDQWINADGYNKTEGKVFNNTYPGPWIEACWGDILQITVINNLKYNGTTIHWHGIRMLDNMAMDGVNGVTQCPIAPGHNFTYKFHATQYGTSWYHSHYSLQYADGLAGPLTIHGPSSQNYDEPVKPFLMTDWGHNSAFHDWGIELRHAPIASQSNLLNGRGVYNCTSSDPKCLKPPARVVQIFQKGRKYLLRLINTSADATFIFSIDRHNITVIGADFVPILPYTTDSVLVGIGQRYHVIVEANAAGINSTPIAEQNYWIRTVLSTPGCGAIEQKTEIVGIVRYNPKNTADATTKRGNYTITCSDEPYDRLFPVVPWIIEKHPANNVTNDTFAAGLTIPGDKQSLRHGNFSRWDLTDDPLWLNFSNPTINNLANTTWDPEYCIVAEDFGETDWIYLLLTWTAKKKDRRYFPAAHPIHLHGHDFAILAQESIPFNESHIDAKFQFNNPPRRDVALLPAGGYLAIAFRADNPGVWILHCHIAWHASSGLALQILERQKDILPRIGDLSATNEVCKRWDDWYGNQTNWWDFQNPPQHPETHRHLEFQDDSGV